MLHDPKLVVEGLQEFSAGVVPQSSYSNASKAVAMLVAVKKVCSELNRLPRLRLKELDRLPLGLPIIRGYVS
mgnify:CR=1 FL=1